MAQFFERKPNKQEDQVMTELKRWWARNPSASMLELEAIAKDLGLRGVRRFPFAIKRDRPAVRV
jgi:hypothetical protein